MLTTRFENISMLENESLLNFYTKQLRYSKWVFCLDEKMFASKLAWKLIWSLLERFSPKIVAIEKTKDYLDNMKVDESLRFA